MSVDKILEIFGEAGLVFVVMALGIVYLIKRDAKREKRYEQLQKEYNDHLKETSRQSIESAVNMATSLDKVAENQNEAKRLLIKIIDRAK